MAAFHPGGDNSARAMESSGKVTCQSFGWGQAGNFQLGVDPGVDGCFVEPNLLETFNGYILSDVAIGSRHSLIVTNIGLISFGCNDHGQLGRNNTESPTGLVEGFLREYVISVAVGENHSLALTSTGTLYSWGDNQHGQLGRSASHSAGLPRPVEFPGYHRITQVACGEHHCVALASDGAIYTWGSNQHGQLGHGRGDIKISLPRAVASIRSLHFVKVYAGSFHSFALTISGALFGWGSNSNGQLGLGNTDNQPFPLCCRALRQQRVKHIACGQNHTAVLTKDGGVFTFGAGGHGQLGHNITQDETLPKKIQELMGSTVTQISCGRFHTIALVPSSGRVYSFGLGAYGQLGLSDSTKRLTPCNIKGPWWMNGTNPLATHCVKLVSAGGNSSLVYVEDKESVLSPLIDQRLIVSRQTQLDAEVITRIITSTYFDDKSNPEISCMLNDLFSHTSIWNGAFLKQDNENDSWCSSTNHGINLDFAKEQLSRLANCPNKVTKSVIESSVEHHLLSSLIGKIPDVESLRIFLILPFLPLFTDPSNCSTIQNVYAHALTKMDASGAKVIDNWLLRIPTRHFRYYLFTFKNIVSHILSMNPATTDYEVLVRHRGIQISLDVMQKLYRINEKNSEDRKISCMDFYVPEIADKVDIRNDYLNWIKNSPTSAHGQPLLTFCAYPFVFDALAKTMLLHADALIQMENAIDQAHRVNLMNILSSSEIDPVHPCLVITVSRDNLVHDTLTSLASHGSADLKKPLKVHFKNEEGVDEGGVKKEFFLLLIREVLDVKYGMFQHYDESRLLWFNAATFEDDMAMFHLIGLLCGLAIYNGTIIDLPFPLALYKKLLDEDVNLDDLRELDPQLGKSLQDLLDYEEKDVEDVFCLTFSITLNLLDEVVTRDLIPNGRNISVTHDTRHDYVHRYISYIFNDSVERMFKPFYDGFHKVCGSSVLLFFHPLELKSMVVGNEEYDWEELEKNCEYKGEFYRHHQTIEYFWEVFYELPHVQKKQFLRFLTGCDRIPIQGMKVLKMMIQPMRISDEYLPVAHTCFNLLDLPVHYSSKEKLRAKLVTAIENSEGFGLA